jgi:serine/threonine-protein kinase
MNAPSPAKGRNLVPQQRALGHVSDAPRTEAQTLGVTLLGVSALLLGLAGLLVLGLLLWANLSGKTEYSGALHSWSARANLPFLKHLTWSQGVRWGLTLGSLLTGLALVSSKWPLGRRVALGTAYWVALSYLLCWAQDPTGSDYGTWLQGRGWVFALIVLVPVVLPATAQRTTWTVGAVALAPALCLYLKAKLEHLPLRPLDALYTIDGLALLAVVLVYAARSSDWRKLNTAWRRASWHLNHVESQSERALCWTPGKNLFKRDVVVDVGKSFPLSQEQRTRFEHDAQQICSLHSQGVATLLDFGLSSRGEPYMVRERVVGHSFERLVKRFGSQLPERTLYLLGHGCHALVEAAELGLVHGTLTPSALWTTQRGGEFDVVKLLGFGQQHWPTDTAEPQANATPGTPPPAHSAAAYRAPERSDGKFVPSLETDVYAIGCIGYHLFTGRPPFIGDAEALERHHAGTHPPALSQLAGLAPPKDLEAILLSCLAKTPSERPTMAALRKRLLACAAATHWTQGRAKDWWQRHPAEHPAAQAKLRSDSRFTLRSLLSDD